MLLPGPERQRIVAEGPEVGVEDKGREIFRRGGVSVHSSDLATISLGRINTPGLMSGAILAVDVGPVKASAAD